MSCMQLRAIHFAKAKCFTLICALLVLVLTTPGCNRDSNTTTSLANEVVTPASGQSVTSGGKVVPAVPSVEYSAECVTTFPTARIGGMTKSKPPKIMNVYVARQKVRIEGLPLPYDVSIFRSDKSVMWRVNAVGKTYIEIPQSQWNDFPQFIDPSHFGKDAEYLGQEMVGVYQCDKYRIAGEKRTYTVWYSKKMSFPIKSEVSSDFGPIVTKLRNVVINPQPVPFLSYLKDFHGHKIDPTENCLPTV